jgi:hypothetical protein
LPSFTVEFKREKMKTQLFRIACIAVLLFVFSACSSIPGMGDNSSSTGTLIGMLTSKLGISNEQAIGGAAALFGSAKKNLSADDFSSVTESLPDIKSLLGKTAKDGSGLASKLGLSSAENDQADAKEGSDNVAGQFSQLGLSSDMVGKFVPIVLDYAKSSGGDNIMNLLKGALQ